MNRILSFLLLALLAAPALAQGGAALWDDGKPEVSIGVYFDLAGTVSVHETVTDTLTAYIILKNNNLRGEGDCIAIEYRLELPDGLILVKDTLPRYSHICLGTLLTGFSQTVEPQAGRTFLLSTLQLLRVGELAADAPIRIIAHPKTEMMQYVSRVGTAADRLKTHRVVGEDAIVNPVVTKAQQSWKPVKSGIK